MDCRLFSPRIRQRIPSRDSHTPSCDLHDRAVEIEAKQRLHRRAARGGRTVVDFLTACENVMAAQHCHPFDVVFTDSCIGGSTVATKLGAKASGLRALYVADYAINPLGVQSAERIASVVQRWVFVAASCAPLLIVACNTASVLMHRTGKPNRTSATGDLVVVTMVELVRGILDTHHDQLAGKRIGVLGTLFTTTEPLYAELIASAGVRGVSVSAATQTERVVAALEYASPGAAAVITGEIGGFVRGLDAVLLGCTCFPLIAPLIRQLNPACLILDPADAVPNPVRISSAQERVNALTIGVSGSEAVIQTVTRNAATLFPRGTSRAWCP